MITKDTPNVKNIELTSLCNFDCPICVSKTWSKGHMDLDLLERILSTNRDVLAGQAVWLHYRGEPLVYPHLLEAIRLFDSYQVKTRLSTNGLLLTDKMIHSLLESPLEGLVVSMITNDPADYAMLRGRDKSRTVHNHILSLIRAHEQMGSPTKIQVMGLNYGQDAEKLSAFIRYYNELGIEVAIHKFSNRINQSRYHPDFEQEMPPVRRLPCKWLFNDMVILYDGSVTTCYFDLASRLILCNIRDFDYSIQAVWDSDLYARKREEHRQLVFTGACENCTDWIYEHPDIEKRYNTFIHLYPSSIR